MKKVARNVSILLFIGAGGGTITAIFRFQDGHMLHGLIYLFISVLLLGAGLIARRNSLSAPDESDNDKTTSSIE